MNSNLNLIVEFYENIFWFLTLFIPFNLSILRFEFARKMKRLKSHKFIKFFETENLLENAALCSNIPFLLKNIVVYGNPIYSLVCSNKLWYIIINTRCAITYTERYLTFDANGNLIVMLLSKDSQAFAFTSHKSKDATGLFEKSEKF